MNHHFFNFITTQKHALLSMPSQKVAYLYLGKLQTLCIAVAFFLPFFTMFFSDSKKLVCIPDFLIQKY